MADNKLIMMNLDDERTKNLADVLGNKTAKKILSYLTEKEASESDVARELNIPANTVNYNVRKLLDSGLIEKSALYFWSVKGKKMPSYKVSKKMVVISPRTSNVGKVFGAFLLTGAAAFFVKLYTQSIVVSKQALEQTYEKAIVDSGEMAVGVVSSSTGSSIPVVSTQIPQLWLWFLLGGLTSLVIYMILNWRKL